MLLPVEVAAFHPYRSGVLPPNRQDSSLWPYSSPSARGSPAFGRVRYRTLLKCETLTPCGVKVRAPYSGRELPATVPCGARTFLYEGMPHSGCLASFACILPRYPARISHTSHFRQ